jgi:transposase
MPALGLRADFDAAQLRRLAVGAVDGHQARRLLGIAAAYDGLSRAEAAMIAGMDRQILRDWVRRFNEEGPEGLVNRRAPGNPRRLTSEQEAELAQIVEGGPAAAGLAHLARWRCADLKALIKARWGVTYHERTIGKLLDRLGFSHITTRPRHYRQDPEAMETFKKTSPPSSRRSAPTSRPAHP